MPNPMFKENRDLSMQLISKLLNQDMGVLSGATPFSMTPQFKAIFEGLSKAGEVQDNRLSTDLTAKGITGGAYEQAMSNQSAGRNSGLLDILNKAWGNVRGNAMEEGKAGFSNWSDWYNKMIQVQQMKNQQEAQGKSDPMGMIMKLIPMLGGAVAGGLSGGTLALPVAAGLGAVTTGMGAAGVGGSGNKSSGTALSSPSTLVDPNAVMEELMKLFSSGGSTFMP
jgi:hypothetical protein